MCTFHVGLPFLSPSPLPLPDGPSYEAAAPPVVGRALQIPHERGASVSETRGNVTPVRMCPSRRWLCRMAGGGGPYKDILTCACALADVVRHSAKHTRKNGT